MRWKVYAINLATSTLRRKFIEKQIRKAKITNYEIVNAVWDPNDPTAPKRDSAWMQSHVNKEELVKPLTDGEIACTLSHKRVLEKFIADDSVDYAVVLEDDALLPLDFMQTVNDAINFMDKDDLFMFSGMLLEPFEYTPVKKLTNGTLVLKSVSPDARPFTTAAYLMHKQVAKRHVKAFYPVTDVTDNWHQYKKRGSMNNIYLTHPYVVNQEVFQSSRDIRSFVNNTINRIIYYQVPVLYPFFKKRRGVTELERLDNLKLVQPKAVASVG